MKHSEQSNNCLRQGSVSKLSSVIRKPHVPSCMAYILYALFTLLILTHLISPQQISTLYLLPKKKNNLWVDIMLHTAWVPISAFSLHCFSVFVFLLEFLICKREKMRSYHSLMCRPISSQRVVHYYKGTGRWPCYAMLCCATLCYACSMWWPLWKCRNNGKGLLASRGGLHVFKKGPDWMYTTYPHTKVPQIKFKGQMVTHF